MNKKDEIKKPNNFAFMMENISKSFLNGKIKANEDITFGAQYGEVVGLVGENGAGKSTLMSILFGLYQPDQGKIIVDGNPVHITSPTVANKFGIGMVPQHFKLVGNMTVTENIMLGVETTKFGILNRKVVAAKIAELSSKYGLDVDPKAKIDSLPIGMKQRVEIIKMLFKDSRIMVFDEPTSVLTPQEAERLIEIIKQFKAEGKVIIFISHKLNEIIDVSDYIVVMRRGKMTGNIAANKATPTKLSEMMVGEAVELKFDNKKEFSDASVNEVNGIHNVIEFKNVSFTKGGVQKLKNVSFTVAPKEIVGLVGIDGNGQSEVVDLVARLDKVTTGEVLIDIDMPNEYRNKKTILISKQVELRSARDNTTNVFKKSCHNFNIGVIKLIKFISEFKEWLSKKYTAFYKKVNSNHSPLIARKDLLMNGVGHIPVDRQTDAIAMDMKVSENMIFNRIDNYSKFGFVNYAKANKFTKEIIGKYDVRGADGGAAIIRGLSGGNQQKAVTGREIEYAKKLLVAAHPTRGVDIGAIKNIYKHIIDKANNGVAVIVLSGELDELIAVSHKLVVFSHGEVMGIVDPKKVTKAELGLMMTGSKYSDLIQSTSSIKNNLVERKITKAIKTNVVKKTTTKKPIVSNGQKTILSPAKKNAVSKTTKKSVAIKITKTPSKKSTKDAKTKKVVTVVNKTKTKKIIKPTSKKLSTKGGSK